MVNELRGEKVDIVEWRDDAPSFIAEALSPAKVKEVRIEPPPPDAEEGTLDTAVVIVPDHQLSLAIGKEGQNARLAARLSGYRVDIRSESEELGIVPEEEEKPAAEDEKAADGAEAPAEEAADADGEGAASEEPATDDAPAEAAATDEADESDDESDDKSDDESE